MELKLYKTLDADNVINKELTDELSLNITLRFDVDVRQPVIPLSRDPVVDYRDYQIAYIPELERYYFIRTVEKGAVITLNLECDYLETYKEDILTSQAAYVRSIQPGDYGEVSLSETGEVASEYFTSDVILEPGEGTIFSVIGVGTA